MAAAAIGLGALANVVGTMVTDYLVKPIERRIRYLFRFRKIVQELKQQKDYLTVQEQINKGELRIRTLDTAGKVDKWLKDAEVALTDVQRLESRIEENKRCFHWCPNWKWRYQLSKEMDDKKKYMAELVENSKFERFGDRPELIGLRFSRSEDFVPSESSRRAVDDIMAALKDEKVKTIGVWGMGGVGKTTLVNQVGGEAKELKLFHEVIPVDVPQTQTSAIVKIQDTIKDFLGLEYKATTTEGRAEELIILLKKKKLLIILDDMWYPLDLNKIGLPLFENGMGCKIIFTTREMKVCDDMKCDVKVPVGVLNDDEAWNLFRKKADNLERASPNVVEEAKKVARECKGLPVAIVTLARALNDVEEKKEWTWALENLQKSRFMEIPGVATNEKNAYNCIKISYDRLEETAKRCLSMFALFPKDVRAAEYVLPLLAWGLGIHNQDSIEKTRSRVSRDIKNLKNACMLLQDTTSSGDIKLHDVIRDVVLWIASTEDCDFMMKSRSGLRDESSVSSYKAISLVDGEEKDFPEGSVYPKLEMLLLIDCNIQSTCFQMMRELKVLFLAVEEDSTRVISLYALRFLPKLRVLLLINFEDFSFLGNLSTLEILFLGGSSSIHGSALACELGKLKYLKFLGLTGCRFESTFPSKVIQKLSNLEEMHLKETRIGENHDDILIELTSLTKLKRYDIRVSGFFHLTEKSWKIKGKYLSKVISLISENLEYLRVEDSTDEFVECLTDHKTRRKVSAAKVIQQLKRVKIRNCENLKVVFQMEEVEEEDSVSTPWLLSNLRELYLDELPSLSCIWDLPLRRASLKSLVELRIVKCPSLEILFPLFLAQSLVLLETLEISRCRGLKQLVKEVTSTTASHDTLWFPKLTKLSITDCDVLECIFPMTIPQGLPQLSLVIRGCPQIKQVVGVVENDINVLQLQFLGSLFNFEVSNCPHLAEAYSRWYESKLKERLSSTEHIESLEVEGYKYKNLVPEGNDDGLNGLISLDVRRCEVLECLVDTTTKNGTTSPAFARLETLHIYSVGGLETLCKGDPPQVFLENLKSLKVYNCDKIVSLSPIGKLQNLWELDVTGCTSLGVVFQMDDDDEVIKENQVQKPLSNLHSIKLQRLNELKGLFKGSPHSFSFQSLTSVIIYNCPKLEYLFPPSVIPSLVVLEKLQIKSCDGLKALFGPKLENDDGAIINPPLCLPKLKTLYIYDCDKLEYALPITMAQGLPALESFTIDSCWILKQVFFGMPKELNGGAEHDAIVLLVSLQDIFLQELPELTSFVPENYIVKAPALKSLKTLRCPRKWNFSLQQTNKQLKLQGFPLTICSEFLRNTKDLTLRNHEYYDWESIVPDIVDLEDLEELSSLHISYFVNLESLVHMSGSCKSKAVLQNLKKLTIEHCSGLEQVFRIDQLCYDKEESQAVPLLLPNLELLELKALPNLSWIIKPASTLYVSLKSLKVLSIRSCHDLNYLFSVSVVQSLSSLEKVIINRCDDLKIVFMDRTYQSNNGDLFLQNLKTVEIEDCQSLQYVFPVSFVQSLSSLEEIIISRCRRLKSVLMDRTDQSNSGNLCLKKLKTVHIEDCPSLENVFPLALARGFPRLQKVRLVDLGMLGHFVAGAKYVETPELEMLIVSKCRRCAFIFQKQVNNHVPLKYLNFNMQCMVGEDAESCEMVNTHSSPDFEYINAGNFEQMFQLQGGDLVSSLEEMTLHHMSWLQHIWKGQIHVATNLRELELHNCSSLTYIFPVTLIRHYLPHLCILKVTCCEKLKQIIANDGNLASSSQDAQLEMKIVFPQLKQIEFKNLSRLESFGPVGYHVVFPSLDLLEIKQYFKMISTFTVDYTTLTVHAKTDQASHSRLDDTSPSQEDIFWSRRRSSLLPPFVEAGAQKISPLKEISTTEV